MTTLASLKLVSAKKPLRSPNVTRRNKLCEKLLEQIKLADALSKGETYAPTRTKTTRDANGNRVEFTKTKRIKPWWFTDTGKTFLQVRYGAKVLQLSAKANAIEVADMAGVVSALETVKSLILTGELDAQITAVSGQIRSGFDR